MPYYGFPPGWIGRQVKVQWDALHVRILDPRNYQLLREHLRQFPGNYRINDEDRSNKTPLSTVQLLARAAKAGTHIGQLCEAIFHNEAEPGIRRILGVLSLAKKHGVAAVDDACAGGSRSRSCELPLCAPLSGAPPPALAASCRSADP